MILSSTINTIMLFRQRLELYKAFQISVTLLATFSILLWIVYGILKHQQNYSDYTSSVGVVATVFTGITLIIFWILLYIRYKLMMQMTAEGRV